MVNHIEEESSSAVKLQLLTATMKLFFKRPAECQHTLGRLLEHAVGKQMTTILWCSIRKHCARNSDTIQVSLFTCVCVEHELTVGHLTFPSTFDVTCAIPTLI